MGPIGGKLLLLALTVFCLLTPAVAGTMPAAIDLGTLGGKQSQAYAINEKGEVVGASQTAAGEWHSFIYRNGVMTDLGSRRVLPGRHFNDRGEVISTSSTSPLVTESHIWQQGEWRTLGSLGGARTDARAINNSGQVVGVSTTAAGAEHAFLWEGGRMKDLGTFGGSKSWAFDINDKGEITGSYLTSRGSINAFLWREGKMTDLGSLGGSATWGLHINGAGEVAGYGSLKNGTTHSFVWRKGKIVDLMAGADCAGSTPAGIGGSGQVPGMNTDKNGTQSGFLWQGSLKVLGPYIYLTAVNGSGTAVGYRVANFPTGQSTAFLWHQGRMNDLEPEVKSGSAAYDINDSGQVAGYRQTPDGDRATVWTIGR